jgi:hypothetical protein
MMKNNSSIYQILTRHLYSIALGLVLFFSSSAQAADTCGGGDKFYFGGWGNNVVTRTQFNGTGSTTYTFPGTQNYNLEVDEENGRLFASSYGGFRVANSTLNGTGIGTLFTTTQRPFAFAYDQNNDVIYWTEWTGSGAILCAPADGSAAPQAVSSSYYYLTGMDIDTTTGELYWYDGYASPPRIQKAQTQPNCGALTGITTLLSSSSLAISYDIDVVPSLGKMFWVDYNNRRVGSANLNGTSPNFNLFGTLDSNPTNIDYHQRTNSLYWLMGNGSVQRGDPTGGTETNAFSVSTTNWALRICEDISPPSLVSITSTTANGTYGPGAVIQLRATYDEPLSAPSSLVVLLNNGVTVTLNTIAGSVLTGNYTVGATGSGQDIVGLDVQSITSESVLDAASNQRTDSSLPGSPNRLIDSRNFIIDTTAPVLSEVTAVVTPTTDTNPQYQFSSTEAGALAKGGACNSTATTATIGTNTIAFASTAGGAALASGVYSNCTLTVTDAVGNSSSALLASSFEVVGIAPGGVGTGLASWLRSDIGVTIATNGSAVQQILDQSGDSNRAYQNTANQRPTFADAVATRLNFNPLMQFDGNNDRLIIDNDADFNTANSYQKSFSIVFRTGANITTRQVVYEQGQRDRGLNVYINAGRLYYGAWNITNNGVGSPWGFFDHDLAIQANTSYLLTFVFNGNAARTGTVSCYLNGELVGTIGGIGQLYNTTGGIGLGAKNNETRYETGQSTGNGQTYFGAIAEFVYYNSLSFSSIERQKLESYLAVKYGFTLHQTPARNYLNGLGQTIYSAESTHDAYDQNIAGIANDPVSVLTQPRSKSINAGAMIEIHTPSNLGSNEYLLWGHNGGALSWAGASVGGYLPLQRVWRFDETGDVGTVSVLVDGSGFPAITQPGNQYVLVVDSDGDLSSGAQSYTLTALGGGFYQATGVDPNGDSFFTVAERDLVAPSLISFTSTTANGTYGPGSAISIRATYSEALAGGSSITVQLNNGVSVVLNTVAGSVVSGTYTIGATGSGQGIGLLNVSSITSESVFDVAGNLRNSSTVPAAPNNLANSRSIAIDVTAPVLAQVTAVSTPTIDRTPPYQFSSTEAGSVTYFGSCASTTASVGSGTSTIDLAANTGGALLADGTYSNCQLRVTDAYGNASTLLNISTFVVAATPPVVSLSAAPSSVAEGSSSTVTATLSNTYAASVTIGLSVSGSASGSDYTISGLSIVIPAGSLSGTRIVSATQDSLHEASETVVVTISSLSVGSGIGSQTTVTILDDDPQPSVTLTSSASTVEEDHGIVTLTATLSAVSGQTTTVNLAFAGSATLGADYTIGGSQIVIPSGSSSGTFAVTIVDDGDPESDENILASISTVVNAVESTPQQVEILITDNDLACNRDPWTIPTGTSGMLVVQAAAIFDPNEAYTPPSASDFESILLGRDSVAQEARRNSAVNYFLNTYGVDFSSSSISGDGAAVLVHVVIDLRYQQTLIAASEQRLANGVGEVYEVAYAMVVVGESTTLYGSWGGVAGTLVPQGTVSFFGESVMLYEVPCFDDSTEARTEYVSWESLEPTFDNGLDNRLHQETAISSSYGAGIARGRRQVRTLESGLAEVLIENITSFEP